MGGSWVVKHWNYKFMCTVVNSCPEDSFWQHAFPSPRFDIPLSSLQCFPSLDGAGSGKIDLLSAAECKQSVIRPRYIVYMYRIFKKKKNKPFLSVSSWLAHFRCMIHLNRLKKKRHRKKQSTIIQRIGRFIFSCLGK